MSLSQFHPAVQQWFDKNFEQPSDIQQQAWPEISKGNHTLIAAPTGSGKTLAAFLSAINDLIIQGINGQLKEETQVVYISPLKALSNDIQKNLQLPLKGINEELFNMGTAHVPITAMVRSGDTTASARTSMIKHPPHILVTTPESLYLLLTSVNGRKLLENAKTVIVDEIHALIGDKRGSHLSLSLERLHNLTVNNLNRIGISATQKPMELVAQFLTGVDESCEIINTGHKRKLDLALEIPRSPLTAVMANEVWEEVYERLEELINSHETTLIFVNTRRLAERLSHNLSERMGADNIMAHHGSMSREHRYDAEQKLKSGELKALIATASLELGIDIGSIDLVCQLGSPKSIAAFLQRVGRSGHSLSGTPKGRLFTFSRDELVECTAIIDAVRRSELDCIIMPEMPIDILAQQIVAELACEEYLVKDLFSILKKAYPYRALTRDTFDEVIKMLSEGYATRRGRRSAYVHHDMVNERLRGRKNARITALVSGGSIPDNFDYDVILEPSGTFIGTLNEDFAIESLPGDIFQLGNNSWRLLRVENGKVRVEDAQGQPPNIPFWLGEAPGRTLELSQAVSRLREEVGNRLGDLSDLQKLEHLPDGVLPSEDWKIDAMTYLQEEVGIHEAAADQLVTYLASAKAALEVMPSQDTIVLERFFDEAGDMHLVVHSPFGSRLNRAWGLSLRKRFCKKFNFELQAAATEDAIILSLGATHSFQLMEVFSYLNANTVRGILVQALLDAPMFEIRWRWNASRALAVLRRRAGQKVPAQIQRMNSEDLVALLFPDQLACFENIDGEREVPDHPLVNQTIHDCLTEAMDIDLLEKLLIDIKGGKKKLIARDLREPSPFAHEILNARPYAFLDDAPAEERRTNAVINRRWLDPAEAKELGKLDIQAIEGVKQEAWPEVSNDFELHDALVLFGFLNTNEIKNDWQLHFQSLEADKRAVCIATSAHTSLWIATERIPQFIALFPDLKKQLTPILPEKLKTERWDSDKALIEIIRGRLEAIGPTIVDEIALSIGLPDDRILQTLLALENDGFVFRGQFTPGGESEEWCERRLLARIHRYTLQKLRKEIEPVSSADFMRFLFEWQHVSADNQMEGPDALLQTVKQLEGIEAAAASWESDILPARIKDYDYLWLDVLCLSGKIQWGKFRTNGQQTSNKVSTPIKTTPISLVYRNKINYWKQIGYKKENSDTKFSLAAKNVLEVIKNQGACFFDDLMKQTKLLKVEVENAISELVSMGLVTSDSYTGLRALLVPQKYKLGNGKRHRQSMAFNMQEAGRWSTLPSLGSEPCLPMSKNDIEDFARIILNRYGVVFRRILEKEKFAPPWRDLVRVLRTMEARGEIRGGRFVSGVWGEQYALAEAIPMIRKVRKKLLTNELITLSAADPLNLSGIITPGRKIPAHYSNRILYRDGIPVALKEGKEVQYLLPQKETDSNEHWQLRDALIQRKISPKLRAYLGKGIM